MNCETPNPIVHMSWNKLIESNDIGGCSMKLISNKESIEDEFYTSYGMITPLLYACILDKIDILEILIEHGCDLLKTNNINKKIPTRFSDLIGLINVKNTNDLKLIGGGNSCLHFAVLRGHVAIIKLLLNYPDILQLYNDRGYTALHLVCIQGDIEILKLLIHKIPINSPSRTELEHSPLFDACANDHLHLVSYLLEHGANINFKTKSGYSVLHSACRLNKLKLVVCLLKYHPLIDIANADGFTPLIMCCKLNFIEIAGLLIENNANVKMKTNFSWTALHVTCYYDHVLLTSLLISNHANINALTIDGYSPLTYTKSDEIAELLMLHGAEMVGFVYDHKNGELSKTLITERFANIVALMGAHLKKTNQLEYNKPLNVPYNWAEYLTNGDSGSIVGLLKIHPMLVNEYFLHISTWYTPLQYSVTLQNEELVDLLLSYGAKVDIVDLFGNTLLMLGIRQKHVGIIKMVLPQSNIKHMNINLESAKTIAIDLKINEIVLLLDPTMDEVHYAIKTGNIEMLSLLLSVVKCDKSEFALISSQNVDLVNILITHSFNIKIDVDVLHKIDMNVVKLVAEHSDVNLITNTKYALADVICSKRTDLVELLMQMNATTHFDDTNALELAITNYCHLDLIKIILKFGKFTKSEILEALKTGVEIEQVRSYLGKCIYEMEKQK